MWTIPRLQKSSAKSSVGFVILARFSIPRESALSPSCTRVIFAVSASEYLPRLQYPPTTAMLSHMDVVPRNTPAIEIQSSLTASTLAVLKRPRGDLLRPRSSTMDMRVLFGNIMADYEAFET